MASLQLLKTRPAQPRHVKIALAVTALYFDQFCLYIRPTGTYLSSNESYVTYSACRHFFACIKGLNTGFFNLRYRYVYTAGTRPCVTNIRCREALSSQSEQ